MKRVFTYLLTFFTEFLSTGRKEIHIHLDRVEQKDIPKVTSSYIKICHYEIYLRTDIQHISNPTHIQQYII